MAVKAVTEVTITDETDILSLVTWYALTSSATAPTKPSTTQTSASVPSPWTTNEPSFDPSQGTKYLYTVIQTRWKDGSCTWDNDVQLSSSYEQAKQAWNKANAAKDAADAATEAANSAAVTKSMSGERTIVTDDAADLPLLTLSPVLGESVQDGTPTPSAPVHIACVRAPARFPGGATLSGTGVEEWRIYGSGTRVYRSDGICEYATTAMWAGVTILFKGDVSLNVGDKFCVSVDVSNPNSSSGTVACYSMESNSSGTRVYTGKPIGVNGGSDSLSLGSIESGITRRYVVDCQWTQTCQDLIDSGGYINLTFQTTKANVYLVFSRPALQIYSSTVSSAGYGDYVPYGHIGIDSVGFNLFDEQVELGIYSMSTGAKSNSTTQLRSVSYIPVSASTNYCLTVPYSSVISGFAVVLFYKNDRTFINYAAVASKGFVFTTPADAAFMTFYISAYYGTTYNNDICLNQSNSLRNGTYEPYQSNTVYIDLKGNELHGLNETYRDTLEIDASGHAQIHKRTLKIFANQLYSGDYGTNPKSGNTLGLNVNPSDSALQQQVQLGGKTSGYPRPIATFLNGATNASSWDGGVGVLNTIAGTTNSYPHNMYCCVGTSDYADAAAFNTALQGALKDEYVIVGLYETYWHTIDLGYVDLPQVTDDSTVYVAAEVQPIIGGSWWTKSGYSAGQAHVDALNAARKNSAQPFVIDTQTTATRWWRADCPDLTELEDGQQLTIWLSHGHASSTAQDQGITAAELVPTETVSTSYSNSWLNLTLGTGQQTGWVPLYYGGSSRMTSHYGVNNAVHLTYKENAISGVPRGWWGDANYTDGNYYDGFVTYFAGKTGAKGIWATSLFMEDGAGTYQNICTASDGTVTSSNRTTATTKKANTNGFKVGSTVYYTTTTYAANTNISGWGVVYRGYQRLFDSRYCINSTLTANFLTPYQPVYLVGTVNANDGLYYLDTTWWTQTPNNPQKVYVLVGACFDSTTSNCRLTLYEENPWYIYDSDTGKLVALNQTVTTFSNKYNTLVDTVDEHTTKVGTFEAQINGHYGTCATAAGTAAKEVRLDATANGWTPYKGAVIAVKFANANTTASPTLTIKDSTGATTFLSAKAVKSYKGGALAASEYGWESGALLSFVYDGTQWALQDGGAIKRLGTAETTIQQTANNVLIKATATGASVSEKTAGGDAVIQSLINVATSGVTIDASKLDIYGVVTIGGLARKNEVDSSIASISASLEEFDDYVRGYFYENTLDTTAQEGKTYYQLTVVPAHYEAVSLSVGDDVSGLYVASGSTYVLTSDTTAVSGKTYYEYIPDEYDYEELDVSTGASLNPNSVYERIYNEDSLASQLASASNRIDSAEDKVELQAENLQALEDSVDDRVSGLEQSMDDRASGLEARANAVDSNIENLSGRTQSLENGVSTLGTQVRSAIQIDPNNGTVTVGYMDAGGDFQNYRTRTSANGFDMLDGNGKVVGHYGEEVQLGAIDGTHMEASGDYLLFLPKGVTSSDYDLDDPLDRESLLSKSVAYIAIDAEGKSTFYMTRSVVVEDMYFGDGLWKFYRRSNRNMSLKWMGGE